MSELTPRAVGSSIEPEKSLPNLRYTLQKGLNKRSLSVFSEVTSTDPKKFRLEPEGDMMGDDVSGDEDDQYEDCEDMPPSPSQPVSNFSQNEDTYRVVPRAHQGAKKIQIKNFRNRNSASQSEATEWASLEEAVVAIHSHLPVKHSLEQLYRMVTNVCVNEKAAEMYTKLLELSRKHLISDRDRLSENRNIPPIEFLRSVNDLWNNFCDQMLMIRNIFLFLDRTYVLNKSSIASIWDAGLTIFSEVVMDDFYMKDRMIKDILSLIYDERCGKQVDRGLIRSLLRMFSSLHIYEQVFERAFLQASREVYGEEGSALSRDFDLSNYLKHVQRRLDEEMERVEFCLDPSTRRPLINVLEHTLISEHMQSFTSKGVECLLENDHLEDLSLLYSLLSMVNDGVNLLKGHLTEYIKKHGKAIVMDVDREKEMVQDLMHFKNRMDRIVNECFVNNEKLVQALKDSFDYFVNTRPNKPAELIAKFVDMKLRVANRESSDEQLDLIMDKVITLFRFVHGKDVFEAFYKKDLAKRLLLGRSASVDAEKAMLSKLKQECGPAFTSRLEGMFKDMDTSREVTATFKNYVDHEPGKALPINAEFNVFILTTGNWPNYEYAEATIPPEMSVCLETYRQFYVGKHSSRKLTWQHSLGHCLLKGTFRKGVTKELQVSLYQTLVLLLFNEKNDWNYEEIAEGTKIEKKELIRTLQSLACAKMKILNKTPKGRDVNPGDTFEVNTQLKAELYRIKVSQVQMKETEEEHRATEEQVNQDRLYQIDAAIVRIMKARRTLTHQQLIQELFGQLRFPVNSSDLKTRIASLMERDYISRDSNDPNTYHYVA